MDHVCLIPEDYGSSALPVIRICMTVSDGCSVRDACLASTVQGTPDVCVSFTNGLSTVIEAEGIESISTSASAGSSHQVTGCNFIRTGDDGGATIRIRRSTWAPLRAMSTSEKFWGGGAVACLSCRNQRPGQQSAWLPRTQSTDFAIASIYVRWVYRLRRQSCAFGTLPLAMKIDGALVE